jgi:pilus assembly protein TadC
MALKTFMIAAGIEIALFVIIRFILFHLSNKSNIKKILKYRNQIKCK